MPTTNRPASALRIAQEKRILNALRTHGAMSRGELAARVGIARTTLSDVIGGMVTRGSIVVVSTDASNRTGSGRPAEILALDPLSGQFLGIDFAHASVHIAVADATHEVIARSARTYELDTSWDERITAALDALDEMSDEIGFGSLQGIAIGVPGPYSQRWHAAHAAAPDSSASVRHLVSRRFQERFALTPLIDNNSRLAALGEATDTVGIEPTDLVYLRIGEGLGGGLVIGGRLVSGASGLSGELGHITAETDGKPCRCGKTGCLETIASVPEILAACRARGRDIHDLDGLAAAVAHADPEIDAVVRDAGAAIGRALSALALAVNPEEIVIGGAVVDVCPALVEQIAATLTYETRSIPDARPVVRASRLKDASGTSGALAALYGRSSVLADYYHLPAEAPTTP